MLFSFVKCLTSFWKLFNHWQTLRNIGIARWQSLTDIVPGVECSCAMCPSEWIWQLRWKCMQRCPPIYPSGSSSNEAKKGHGVWSLPPFEGQSCTSVWQQGGQGHVWACSQAEAVSWRSQHGSGDPQTGKHNVLCISITQMFQKVSKCFTMLVKCI